MTHQRPLVTRNRLLASLAPPTLAKLQSKLLPVVLPLHQTLYRPEAPIDLVYFPEAGVVSLVAGLENGLPGEVGVIGREGMVGAALAAGVKSSFNEAMVQAPGSALRMTAGAFCQELDENPVLRSVILRYNEALHAQVSQTAACNSRHTLEQRLARWLLMAHDRLRGDVLPLTQEFLAMMLGVHRPSVSLTAGILQRAGLISYVNGVITVLNRSSLETASCECYGAVQRRFDQLLGKQERA